MKRLYRSRDERMVAGVAGGIAEYFDVDPTLVRLAFVAFTFAGAGSGLAAYLILALITPLEPAGRERMRTEEVTPSHYASTPEEMTRHEVQEAQVPGFRR